jgi:prophage maintenance system killer protein
VSHETADPLVRARYWDIRDAHDSMAGTYPDIEPGQVLHDEAIWLAAQQPFLAFASGEAYSDAWGKAACVMRILAQRHPFTQGCKRTAWLYSVFLLGQLGITMPDTVSMENMLGMMTAVATRKLDDVQMIAKVLREDVYLAGLYG